MKDHAAAWPASRAETRPLADLLPYARNSRTHSEAQVAEIAASISEFGWTQPVLIDEAGTILAGHGRVLAARTLGIAEAPCIVADGWSDAQKRAYVIADNKLALNAGWDEAILAEELAALEGAFDLALTGFSDEELSALLAPGTAGRTDPDEAPPLEAAAVSVAGDTWTLGRHRLRCGDATNAADVAALLGEVRPGLMVTDPPYGVEYDAAWRERFGAPGVATGKVLNDDRADWREAWALFPGDIAYVWHGALHNVEVAASLTAAGFAVRSQIVWIKTRAPISRGAYHWQHEPAFYAERDAEGPEGFAVDQDLAVYTVRPGRTANWRGGRKQSTVWFVEHLKNDTGHSTQKPVEVMRRPIVNHTAPGQAVYEPFAGSGTTVIAGEMEGRPVYAMELSPHYVDVIVRRWQAFTGIAATDASGRTFEARAA